MHLTSVVSHREYCSIAYCPWSMTSLETDMVKLQTGLLTRFSILVALNVVIPLIVSLVCSFCSEDHVQQFKFTISAIPVERNWWWSMRAVLERGYLLRPASHRTVIFLPLFLLNIFFFQMSSSILNLSIFSHPFLSENYRVLGSLDQWVINSQVWQH